jgi:hypothetical protein
MMAVKNLVPEAIGFTMVPALDLLVAPSFPIDPNMVVIPYNMASYILDEFRVKNGWPVEVPPYDVRQKTLISTDGTVISNRQSPATVQTGADVRWVATELSWDDVTLTWRPEDGPYPSYVWSSSVEFAPVYINDYTYRVGKELLTVNGLNFSGDNHQHLWSNFTGGFGSAAGFTLIFALSLQSRFGLDNTDVDYAGIFGAGHATPPGAGDTFAEDVTGGQTNLQMRGRYLWVNSNQMAYQQLFPINLALTRSQPSYLAVVVNPPYTKVFMGFGTSTMQVAQVQTGPLPEANHLDWVIGRATGDLVHCADMTLFDLGLYVNPLSDDDVLSEISKLSQAYGG